MDTETYQLIESQQELNKSVHDMFGALMTTLDRHQRMILEIAVFLAALAGRLSGEELEKLPPLPGEEDLARTGKEIAELKRLLDLGSDPAHGA